MRLMLCTRKTDVENLIHRISQMQNAPYIAGFYEPSELFQLSAPFPCDALWIAIDGAAGMEAVIAARERDPHIPLLWMSEDKMFGMIAHSLQVSGFLTRSCTDEEFTAALEALRGGGEVCLCT